MGPLPTSHYKQQITAQIAATDSDGEGLSDCMLGSGGGVGGMSSVHISSMALTDCNPPPPPIQPAITIRAPAQTACCDLLLFVPGMILCQSGVRCSAEGQGLTVSERQEFLLAANVPRISTVSSSYSTSEAGKKAPSLSDRKYSNVSHQERAELQVSLGCLGLLGTSTDWSFTAARSTGFQLRSLGPLSYPACF